MFGGLSAQVREARAAIIGIALMVACAAIGFVWLSIGAAQALAAALPAPWPAVIIGLGFLAPIAISAVAARLRQARRDEAAAAPAEPQGFVGLNTQDQMGFITRAVGDIVDRAPLAALAIAALAGMLAVRFPLALPLLIQVLQDAFKDRRPDADGG